MSYSNAGLWENSKFLEALEISIVLIPVAIAIWAVANVPNLQLAAMIFIILLLFSGVFYAAKRTPALHTVGFGKSVSNALNAALFGLAAAFIIPLLSFLVGLQSFSLYNPVFAVGVIANAFLIGVIAPLVEETFFRGSWQPTLSELGQRLGLPPFLWAHVGVFGSALSFGAEHYLVSNGQTQFMLAAVLFGVVVGYGNIYFKSTAFSYSAHLVNNLRAVKIIPF